MKVDKNEIIEFYKNADDQSLISRANKVCEQTYGNKVYLRGLIEFSNFCDLDCLYCGIRHSNKNVSRYRLEKDQILEIIKVGHSRGLKTFVMQSGEDNYYTTDMLVSIIESAREIIGQDVAITLSCGAKSKNDYKRLKDAGVNRYLIRFETSDEKLHQYIRNGISLKQRLKSLYDLKELGFEVGSGYMVGLPDETEDIRINNALLAHELQLDMIGIGPFIPNENTPLAGSAQSPIEKTIRAAALLRLLLPEANIPATTAAGSLDPLGRENMLRAGANVLMPNITPADFKKDYLLYPGKICLDESGFECIDCLKGRVSTIGKELSFERGDSISGKNRNK